MKDPQEWEEDVCYQKLKERVQRMTVVNGCTERGNALIERYNQDSDEG